jgi:hypothetical protein
VGIVHGERCVHFVAVAETRAALHGRIAEYIRSHADTQLYAEDARIVSQLLERAEVQRAIRYYFDRVGDRWDREWLNEATVDMAAPRARLP